MQDIEKNAAAAAGSPEHSAAHEDGHAHHHHTHADGSCHAGGHHLLQVEDLSVSFSMYDDAPDAGSFSWLSAPRRVVEAIRRLSIGVHAGEIVAVVGASGSGKTLLADAILGISAENSLVEGTVWFDGERCDEERLAALRGREIAFVPQSVESLDPLMKVGKQVELFVRDATPEEARRRRREVFERYGLDDRAEPVSVRAVGRHGPPRAAGVRSGEQAAPMIADEPTPGLDLELAVRAMDDFRAFADEGGGVLLITHDIELVLRVADRIAVFKDGMVVEETAVANFASPELLRHPFSRALWHALPEHGFEGSDRQGVR